MARVAVVTDSTSYLPRGWAEVEHISVVPVQVVVAGQAYDETDVDDASFVTAALSEWKPVSTSRPSPERFLITCEERIAAGADGIVIATLSADLSATYESALMAARELTVPVSVIDSRSIAMGLGFAVLAGARAAAQGADVDEVSSVITKRATGASVLFYVDTLEYLRRGGRLSSARAAVGQALAVKPILELVDGHVVQLDKVRTASKALSRIVELAVQRVGAADVDVAVQHLGAPERASEVAAACETRLGGVVITQCAVGGVVGAHVGPGMVAVVVSPR